MKSCRCKVEIFSFQRKRSEKWIALVIIPHKVQTHQAFEGKLLPPQPLQLLTNHGFATCGKCWRQTVSHGRPHGVVVLFSRMRSEVCRQGCIGRNLSVQGYLHLSHLCTP